MCIDNLCSLASCFNSNDCKDDESCVDGVCVSPPECTSNADCPNGQICNDEGECTHCNDDSECNIGQKCIDNVCEDPECTNNADCSDGQVCKQGVCTNCENDSDCPNGQECIIDRGACGKVDETCNSDKDCLNGQICFHGDCIVPECVEDRDCRNGQICVENECLKTQSCDSSRDCSNACCINKVCQLPDGDGWRPQVQEGFSRPHWSGQGRVQNGNSLEDFDDYQMNEEPSKHIPAKSSKHGKEVGTEVLWPLQTHCYDFPSLYTVIYHIVSHFVYAPITTFSFFGEIK